MLVVLVCSPPSGRSNRTARRGLGGVSGDPREEARIRVSACLVCWNSVLHQRTADSEQNASGLAVPVRRTGAAYEAIGCLNTHLRVN